MTADQLPERARHRSTGRPPSGGSRWWGLHRRQVPVRQQLSSSECGAACLAMIVSYYGRACTVAECREHCDNGRDGVSALGLARAARSLGLRTRAFSADLDALRDLPLPAVLHWNFNHFVVLERWAGQDAVVVDPAAGRRRVDRTTLSQSFTGVVLTFEPGAGFGRHGGGSGGPTFRGYLREALRSARCHAVLGQILLASLLLTGVGLVIPLLTMVVVDIVLGFQATEVLHYLPVAAVLIVGAQFVAGYLRGALILRLRARLDAQMMLDFFERVLALPYPFLQRRSSGDLITRLGSIATVRDILTNQTMSVVIDGGMAVCYAVTLLVVSPLLGGAAVVLGLAQLAIVVLSSRRARTLTQADLIAQADSQGYLVEALTGVETIKASGKEKRATEHWTGLFLAQLGASLRKGQLDVLVNTATSTLRAVSPVLLLTIGALQVLGGTMSLGSVLALQVIAMQFLNPLTAIAATAQQLQVVGAHFERILDILSARPEQAETGTSPAPRLSGHIELRDVSFRYTPASPAVVRDVSLTIRAGQTVAIVGRTGSGKSTLAKLLLGLYRPTVGEVRYDGIALSGLDLPSVRAQLGTVLQNPAMFSGSIRDNVAFGEPARTLSQVVDAARLAAIHDEIQQMPMGYETLVSEGGAALSGGQRQRLSLARALIGQPAVLLLDEATSHLDAGTEATVAANIAALSCTRVIVAHRLSTIRGADVIVVLDEGRVIEQGTHDELVALGGRYADLVRRQLAPATP